MSSLLHLPETIDFKAHGPTQVSLFIVSQLCTWIYLPLFAQQIRVRPGLSLTAALPAKRNQFPSWLMGVKKNGGEKYWKRWQEYAGEKQNKTKHLAKDGGKAIQVFVTVILTSALNVHHNQKGSEHL